MENNQLFKTIYDDLKSRFLDPLETNRGDIHKLIDIAFQNIPDVKNVYDAYIGEYTGDYSWLREYDHIPYYPKKREELIQAISRVLHGHIKWHSPTALHNINPPVMLDCVVVSALANLYNPNALWDFVSAGVLELEQQIIRQMGSLCGWGNEVDGAFTYGGKGCLTYAVRIGLNRCLPGVSSAGIAYFGKSPVVITSEENHYSIDTVCSLLGLGTNSCIRIKTTETGVMDFNEFCRVYEELVDNNIPIACIIVSGGNTLDNSIDPLKDIYDFVCNISEIKKMTYRPYIHFDTVVGWPWLFFKDYDFDYNPLQIDEITLNQIKKVTDNLINVTYADSIGIDFHKDGFSPYISSLFLIKNGAELHSIYKNEVKRLERKEHGSNFVQHHTIEHSRSAAPIFSAWIALQGAGVGGFQAYIANLMSVANIFRNVLPNNGLELLNAHSLSFASVFWAKMPGGPETYQELLESNDETIERANDYNYKFFLHLASGKYGSSKIVLGFLPEYKVNSRGNKVSALRVYPMSMALNAEMAFEIAKQIAEIKKRFDENYEYESYAVIGNRPTHVPK